MVGLTADQRVAFPMLRTSWLQAAFVHWPVPPDAVQALLPAGLTADVREGSAWVSLASHLMADMRPLGLPLLPNLRTAHGGSRPGLANTREINLRSYVRGPDGGDGLWFFSLDADNPIVVAAVRGFVGAPYFAARLSFTRDAGSVRYAGSRLGAAQHCDLTIRPGPPMEPTPLDVWLTGRWRAYTRHLGRLMVTPVDHEPWPLQSATVEGCIENLTAAAGLPAIEDPRAHFSEGVRNVRVGPPRPLR